MKNKHDEMLDKLFAAARSVKADPTATEDYFETRLMARIGERKASRQADWSVWSWRLVPWLSLMVIIIGISSILYDPGRSTDLFSTFLAGSEDYQVTALLVGE